MSTVVETLDADELTVWRDALVAGGLPGPDGDRFRPLRAGVVNLWEYEVAEYWFAEGRAQFVGRNESGKSTLMTLTTLILLAGDTSPHLIDTLGTANKRFRYYVEPENSDEDRRDPSTSTSRGWAWVEYGRIVDGEPAFVTALLYANVKRAREAPQLTWVVCEGPARVRDGITLARGTSVVPPADACEDPAWQAYPSGVGYRQHLARAVFDAPAERLDDYVRMLKVIRTPKLGSRLNTAFLRDKLREALPPLAEHEVAQLADGWEELEKIALDRDSADEARKAVDAFRRRAWWPWAAAEVRRAADTLSAANNALDDITRRAREAGDELSAAEAALSELDEEIEHTLARRRGLASEYEELRQSQRFKDAETAALNAASLAERAAGARTLAVDRAEEARKAVRDADEMATRLGSALTEAADERRGYIEARDLIVEATGRCGIATAAGDWLAADDIDRVDIARHKREEQAKHLVILGGQVDAAARDAEAVQRAFAEARARADTGRERADLAREAAEHEAQAVADRLATWCTSLDLAVEREVQERWLDTVAGILEVPRPTPVLASSVLSDYLTPRRVAVHTARASETDRAERLRQHAAELQERIEQLRSADEPARPEPTGWRRRERPDPSLAGAPLWRLLDPAPGTEDADIDVVEAVLAATGLLDLWVNPDGTWSAERDGLDAVALVGPTPCIGQSLASVLQVAEEVAPPLRHVVQQLLDAIAWSPDGGPLGAGPVGLAADGRWRTPVAAGAAAPPSEGASLLGTAARRRWVERETARLGAERQAALTEADDAADRAAELDRLLEQLRAWEQALPDDSGLVGLVLEARDADRRRQEAEDLVTQLAAELDTANRRLDDARSAAATWAADHALPLERHDLDRLVDDLVALALGLEQLRSRRRDVERADREASRSEEDAQRAAADAEAAATKQHAAEVAAADLEQRSDVARRLLDGEIVDVLDQVAGLSKAIEDLGEQLDGLGKQKFELSVARVGARSTLGEREEAADAARGTRDAATAAWWEVADHGPALALGIDLPSNRSFTSALESARSARAALRPPQWPAGDRDAQAKRVETAWRKLLEETLVLRAVLEANAGRTVRIVEPTDDQLPRIEIVVDGTGQGYEPPQANTKLAEQHQELRQAYDENMHKTLHELLGSTFIEHLRDRLEEVARLHTGINSVLGDHPTGTTRTMLRVQRVSVDGDTQAAHVLRLLEGSSYEYLTSDAQDEVRRFLRLRIDEAREAAQAAGDPDWRDRLSDALDYRHWFDTVVEKRSGDGGRWSPLTTGAHGRLSGGASVVTLMLPLVATLAAMYASTPHGPRLLWLDEAFDGVDKDNRVSILRLLREFDMDYLLAGPSILVNVATVPSAAVWDVVRAEHPEPGVALMASLWAAGTLHLLDVPDDADRSDHPPPASEDQLVDLADSRVQ